MNYKEALKNKKFKIINEEYQNYINKKINQKIILKYMKI